MPKFLIQFFSSILLKSGRRAESRRFSLILLFPIMLFAQTVYVQLNHPVYNFIDRQETRGYISGLYTTKPFTRTEVGRCLEDLVKKSVNLSKPDQQLLDLYLFEFAEHVSKKSLFKSRFADVTKNERVDRLLPNILYQNGRNLLHIQSGLLTVNFDPVLHRSRLYAQADTLTSDERVFENTNGIRLWGCLGKFVGYWIDIRDTKEWGTRDYPPKINTTAPGLGFVQGGYDHFYHDETNAYLVFEKSYLALQFGKDENQWGPGQYGQLMLSPNATSYDQLKLTINHDKFKYTYLLGWLKHYTPLYFYGDPVTKVMTAHRIEFLPFNFLRIGLAENSIHHEKYLEPSYLNPVMFFRAADHYSGDNANSSLGFDFTLKYPGYKFYGELFVDDVTTSRLGEGYYGNKLGFLTGAHKTDLFGIGNLDANLEYSRIRPYVYTHRDSVVNYLHFTTNMGHWLGPNADDLWLELSYQPTFRSIIKIDYERSRFGENTSTQNFGGTITEYLLDGRDPLYLETLDGDLKTVQRIGINASYQFLLNAFFNVYYNFYDGETELYQSHSLSILPGQRTEFGFSININY